MPPGRHGQKRQRGGDPERRMHAGLEGAERRRQPAEKRDAEGRAVCRAALRTPAATPFRPWSTVSIRADVAVGVIRLAAMPMAGIGRAVSQ